MFLGVDGGGTKCAFCLLARDGSVPAMCEGPGVSYLAVGFEGVRNALQAGVEEACGRAGIGPADIDFGFFGLPGYGESRRDQAALDSAPSVTLPRERYRCGNDMVCGWAGAFGGDDGINVIAGTGAIAYGERAGREARCGGWGELFDDAGSAYWIAIQGLGAFARMSDGRLPRGALYAGVRDRLAIADDFDVIDLVLNQWRGARARVASLAPLVTDAAAAGDAVARDIVRRAAVELARMVDAVRVKLGYAGGETVPVGYSGGVLAGSGLLLPAFEAAVAALAPQYSVRAPLFAPALGAALHAASLCGTPVATALVHGHRNAGLATGGVA